MALNLTETDIAWIAGLLEGEGAFTLSNQFTNKDRVKRVPRPRLSIAMTDLDVIVKLAKLLDTGITHWTKKTKSGKNVYGTSLARIEDLTHILNRILPYMGARRSLRIKEILNFIGGSNS